MRAWVWVFAAISIRVGFPYEARVCFALSICVHADARSADRDHADGLRPRSARVLLQTGTLPTQKGATTHLRTDVHRGQTYLGL